MFIKKKLKRTIASVLLATVAFGGSPYFTNTFGENVKIKAEESSHWYTQKGWSYEGKTLTSLCYIASYAMVLHSMGHDVNPLDVYIANGKSNYCNHSLIANTYGVDATSETGSLSGMTADAKQAFIQNLIGKYPQGVIVGGHYGLSTHYIVAKKVVDGQIYFDDPAYATSAEGCCIDVSKIYKLTWSTITQYRVIKEKTTSETQTVEVSETPIVPDAYTETPDKEVVAKATATPVPISQAAVEEVVATPVPQESSINNPLGKYKIPTRTIYYKTPAMKGEDIKWLEAAMKKLGCVISVDGKYTKVDQKAIMSYQRKKGLTADGYVGKTTRKRILSDLVILLTKVKRVSGLKISTTNLHQLAVSEEETCQINAKWSKVQDVTGYEVLYAAKKNFKNAQSMTSKSNDVIIGNLKNGQTYFVKVRAYKTVNDTKVYGSYSAIKKITIS